MSSIATSPLTTAQQQVLTAQAEIAKYLQPTTQAIFAVATAAGTPNEDALTKTLGVISAVTNAAATIPNPSVQAYAGLASFIEQLVASTIGVVASATAPAIVVPDAHPPFILKFLHPNIAKQEEALAASAAAPVVVPVAK